MKILASVFQLWPVYKVNWPSSDREELNWNGGRLIKKPNVWDGKELNFLLLRKKILLSNSQIGITTFYNKVLQRSLISLPLLCARRTFLETSFARTFVRSQRNMLEAPWNHKPRDGGWGRGGGVTMPLALGILKNQAGWWCRMRKHLRNIKTV